MAHLPRSPITLLLFFLGVVHVPASHGTPLPPTHDGSMCSSASFWCGGVEIHYPFHLSNATGESPDHTRYACGYPDLNISCTRHGEQPWSWTPTIRLGGDDYTVRNIFYNTSTIVLADSDVVVPGAGGGGVCPAVRHNVSFGHDWLRLHGAGSHANLTFFFGCYARDDPVVPTGLHAYNITCPEFKSPAGGGASFVFAPSSSLETDAYDYELAAAHCGEVVTVPVRGESLTRMNQTVLARGGYVDVLREGFEVGWRRRTTDRCYQCERRGHCAYGEDGRFLGCLCYDGSVAYPSCRGNDATVVTASPLSKSFAAESFDLTSGSGIAGDQTARSLSPRRRLLLFLSSLY